MGGCTLTPRFGDFGDRKHIIDIKPNNERLEEAEESDPGSIINGGSGVPVIKPELKK